MEPNNLMYLFIVTDVILFIIVMALLSESKHMNDNCLLTRARLDSMSNDIEKLSDRVKDVEEKQHKKIFKKKKEE